MFPRTCKAAEGMSLDAQRSAIESYCAMMGIKAGEAVSGRDVGREGRAAWARRCAADSARPADVLIVLKFDRPSRSIALLRAV